MHGDGNDLVAMRPGRRARLGPPGRFDLPSLVAGGQVLQSPSSLVDEQVGAGMRDLPCAGDGLAFAAPVSVGLLLDSLAAPIQRTASQADHGRDQ